MTSQNVPSMLRETLRVAGALRRRELLDAGVTDADLRRWVRSGVLLRPRNGVYALPPDASTLSSAGVADGLADLVTSLRAAVTAGSDVVVSHRSAAQLWGLPVWRTPTIPEVTRAYGTAGVPGVQVHRYAVSDPEVVSRFGLPTTSPTRTLIDVCRVLPPAEAMATVDAGVRELGVDVEEVYRVLESLGDINFRRRTMQVMAWADPASENAFESFSRTQFLLEDIPAPLLQWWVGDGDQLWYRPDKLWPSHGLIGEADGRWKYQKAQRDASRVGGDPLVREKNRQEWFEDRDFLFVRFGYTKIVNDPAAVAARWRQLASRQRGRKWQWPPGTWLVEPGPWPPERGRIRDASGYWIPDGSRRRPAVA